MTSTSIAWSMYAAVDGVEKKGTLRSIFWKLPTTGKSKFAASLRSTWIVTSFWVTKLVALVLSDTEKPVGVLFSKIG